MTRSLTPAILTVALFGATAALADDDDCRSPMSQWQSQDAAMQHAGALGIEVRRLKIDDGCYEIKGRDSDGNKVELKLEPATLALRELEVEFRAGADPSRYLKGARAPAPMKRKAPANNPLFEKGAKPKVESN
mgnify:FL=1